MNKNKLHGLIVLVLMLAALTIFFCSAKQNAAPRLIKDSLVFIYPSEAREKQIEGTVVLKIFVSENGDVTETEIDRSSGYDILDETALKVAETAKFKPARINGATSAAWITWPLVFEISTMEFYPDEWIEKTSDYLFETSSSEESKRRMAQQALYYHYKDFSRYMVKHRRIFLNKTVLDVVSNRVRKQWRGYADTWPLTFILFQDFVFRFPNSEFREEADAYLIEYIKNEMFQIKVSTSGFKGLYERFLTFLKENYPDSITDDLLLNTPKE